MVNFKSHEVVDRSSEIQLQLREIKVIEFSDLKDIVKNIMIQIKK